ncbi:MAG: hydrogenase expression/formation protein HypE [Candidatus Zixiibacteriota bacterium]
MTDLDFKLFCPTPMMDSDNILMAHGGGGRLMHQLLERVILPPIDNQHMAPRHDACVFELGNSRLAFTTDSFVVNPIFFPGGDIGKLAVCGTVNDLAMAGARPLYLSLALIIEEGLPVATLSAVMESIRSTASSCNVQIITGDTKVVEHGKGDGLFINTAGIGIVEHSQAIAPANVVADDSLILSGDIGRHGIAIMAQRENLKFESTITSDCAPLHREIVALLEAGIEIHCLRDLTRGGLASTLVEVSGAANCEIEIDESLIPVSGPVRAACELLGFDPLHVANEGRFLAIVPQKYAALTINALRAVSPDNAAQIIGSVGNRTNSQVTMRSLVGGRRIVDMLSGEQLPRIC